MRTSIFLILITFVAVTEISLRPSTPGSPGDAIMGSSE
jgi:hypothetical protein